MSSHLSRVFATAIALICLSATPAFSGAWTLGQYKSNGFSTFVYSTATRSYDDHGNAKQPIVYQKLLSQTYIEGGLTDWLTIFADLEIASAKSDSGVGVLTAAKDIAYGGGTRVRLTDKIGVLSMEISAKSAGAFNMSVSANGKAGRQEEVRLLYGTNFKLWGRDAFVDAEIGERLVSGAQPNETPIDITVGWHVTPDFMVMAQSFNIVSGGDAKPPYDYYRSHKLELSLVYDVTKKYAVQIGGYISPAGQNALQENGVAVSLWTHV